jgi:hypothetical protein
LELWDSLKKSQLKYPIACDDHISCEINILHGMMNLDILWQVTSTCEMFISYLKRKPKLTNESKSLVCNNLCDIKVELSKEFVNYYIILFINFFIILSLFHCQFLTNMEGPWNWLVWSVKKKALWQMTLIIRIGSWRIVLVSDLS